MKGVLGIYPHLLLGVSLEMHCHPVRLARWVPVIPGFTLRICSWLTCITGTPSQHIHRDSVTVCDDMIP